MAIQKARLISKVAAFYLYTVLYMLDEPQLSVIIASYNSSSTIANCLRSLRRQTTDKPFEVIVIDSSNDATDQLVAQQFPEIRLLHFKERKYPGDARNAGVEAARADIVASIDADCVAREDWVEEVLRAHQDPSLVIGGVIENANPGSYVGWAAYLCEFTQWMPGAPRRWLADIATANISYKRKYSASTGASLKEPMAPTRILIGDWGARATICCGSLQLLFAITASKISSNSCAMSSTMAGIAGECVSPARNSRSSGDGSMRPAFS